MDVNHIEASLCFPTFPRFCGQTFSEASDKELALLCVKAYNDYQHGIVVHGNFGHADALMLRRDRGVQIGQRFGVIEPGALGHEALDELKHATGAIDEAAQCLAGIGPFSPLTAFIEEPLGAGGVFGWWQPEERQEVAGFEVDSFLFEFRLALGLDQGRRGVGKAAFRIMEGGMALGLDEDRPSRSQAP